MDGCGLIDMGDQQLDDYLRNLITYFYYNFNGPYRYVAVKYKDFRKEDLKI